MFVPVAAVARGASIQNLNCLVVCQRQQKGAVGEGDARPDSLCRFPHQTQIIGR